MICVCLRKCIFCSQDVKVLYMRKICPIGYIVFVTPADCGHLICPVLVVVCYILLLVVVFSYLCLLVTLVIIAGCHVTWYA